MTVQKTRVGHVDQASQITVEPVGNVTKTNVQSALEQLTSLVTPNDAEFVVGLADVDLPNARVLTDTATISWNVATANQAKANIADAELLALAGLTSAADSAPYFTGSGTAALATLTTFGRSLIDDADAPTARATLGLVIGTNVQAYDAELAAIASTTSAADALPYFTGSGTATTTTLTAAARTVLDDTTVGAMLTTLGGQPVDATLTALAAYNTNGLLTQTAADTFTGRTLTGPAAGITVSNGNGVSGNPTLALANDLSAVEGLASNGLAARTATDTWAVRTITGPAAGITVSNGDGVSGNPTLALADDLAALEALAGTNTIYYRSGASTWSAVSIGSLLSFSAGTLNITDAELAALAGLTSAADSAPYFTGSGTAALMTVTTAARTVLDDTTVGAMLTTLGGQPLDATLTSLAAYNTNGLLTQTAADTFTGRTITGTANEITATNGDGVSGNPTLSLPSALTFTGKTVTGGTFSGAATTGTFDVQQALTFSGDISPSQITADQNNYAPTGFSTATVLRLNSDATRNITGLAGGSDGRTVFIHNVGSFNIVLKDESASSTAGNRFALTADVTLAADATSMLQYDSTSSRWRVIGGAGSGGAGDALTSGTLAQFAATTSAQLAGVISDETGSGALMFATSPTITTDITIPNAGLKLFDTDSSHKLAVVPGSNLTANRTLTVTTGDADRTIDVTLGRHTMPIGSVIAWTTGTAPTGTLECDGSAVSRTTYADLYAVVGTIYGTGNGSTTFNLPDYRGEFLRGWAHGSTNDPDKASRTDAGGGGTGDNIGTKQGYQVQAHTHTYNTSTTDSGADTRADGSGSGATNSPTTSSTGGNETRPRNVNVMFCIVYQ